MNKPDFNQKMKQLMAEAGQGDRLLLHSCCGPCSSRCLEALKDKFSVTVFYYNPNITDPAEYENCTPRETQLMLQTQYQLRLKAIREAEPPQPTPAPEQKPEHHPSLIPPPPMPPVSQGSQPTNPAEMRRFVQSLITAFSAVAEAKRQLRNPYNISRAETFATAVNDAWQTLATTLTPEEQQ